MQQINLHQPVVRRKQGTLSAQTACTSLLTIALALAGIWGFAWWQLRLMRGEVEIARAQREAQHVLEAAQTTLLNALPQEDLDQLILTTVAAVDVKTRAIALLQSEKGDHAAFADRLTALARRHVDGIWLDQLTLGAGRGAMSLSGSALTPELVPRYLQSLAADPALRGGEIDNFVIDRASPQRSVAHPSCTSMPLRAPCPRPRPPPPLPRADNECTTPDRVVQCSRAARAGTDGRRRAGIAAGRVGLAVDETAA